MYGKGDYISYGGHGVCQIADVRSMDFGSGEQEYLVIEPIASGSATIYLPSANQTVQTRMRPVLPPETTSIMLISKSFRQLSKMCKQVKASKPPPVFVVLGMG